MTAIYWTRRSTNGKTGPIAVSTSDKTTCPPTCPLLDAGCYAKYGPLGSLWAALTVAGPNASWPHGRGGIASSIDWTGLCNRVGLLGRGELWRHNQAGDLPHRGGRILAGMLRALVRANGKAGAKGFTYTHHIVTKRVDRRAMWNRALVRWANANGFTINLSANGLAHADHLAMLHAGPVVTIVSDTVGSSEPRRTPGGRVVRDCPATYAKGVTCKRCQWCAMADREWIVGFPAHGARANDVAQIAGRA